MKNNQGEMTTSLATTVRGNSRGQMTTSLATTVRGNSRGQMTTSLATTVRGNSRGQMTLVAILMVMVALLMFATVLPTITYAIDLATPNLSGMSAVVLQLIPLFMIIGIVMTIFLYSSPQQAGRRY